MRSCLELQGPIKEAKPEVALDCLARTEGGPSPSSSLQVDVHIQLFQTNVTMATNPVTYPQGIRQIGTQQFSALSQRPEKLPFNDKSVHPKVLGQV